MVLKLKFEQILIEKIRFKVRRRNLLRHPLYKCKEAERADLTESVGVAGVGDVNESVLCKCLKSPHCPPVKFDISNH